MIMLGLGKLKRIRLDAGPELEGQSLVEYAMIILFVVIASIIALMATADAIVRLWGVITDVLVPVFSV